MEVLAKQLDTSNQRGRQWHGPIALFGSHWYQLVRQIKPNKYVDKNLKTSKLLFFRIITVHVCLHPCRPQHMVGLYPSPLHAAVMTALFTLYERLCVHILAL